LDPGSGKSFSSSRISDPGSQTHIFKRLVTIYCEKSTILLSELPKNLLYLFKNEIISIFLLCCCCWIPDTGSWMDTNQDPGSGINIPDLQIRKTWKTFACPSSVGPQGYTFPFELRKSYGCLLLYIVLTPSWLPLSVFQPYWRQVIMTGRGGGEGGIIVFLSRMCCNY
jgi:hypothetical protein